nr:FAD-dependent oxidoreductase [Micromonospora sp. KC606]
MPDDGRSHLLTRFARSVTVIHRRDSFRASRITSERALNNEKIHVVWNSVVEEILGHDGTVAAVRLRDIHIGETRLLDVTGVFVAIGHDPRSGLFRGQVTLDNDGYVTVAAPGTRTNLPGVFAAGDLLDHTYRQAITAAGTGCAALDGAVPRRPAPIGATPGSGQLGRAFGRRLSAQAEGDVGDRRSRCTADTHQRGRCQPCPIAVAEQVEVRLVH